MDFGRRLSAINSWGVIFAYRKPDAANIASQTALESVNTLRDDPNKINVTVAESSIEISHLQHTIEKQDSRLTRLENHSLNLSPSPYTPHFSAFIPF